MVLRQLDGSIVQALFAFLNMQHWLVTHLVNSTSNVTSRHRGPKRTRGWLQSGITTAHVLSMCQSILWRKLSFSSYSVGSCTFSVLCMYSTFGHHPHPLGYLCAKLCFYRPKWWASPRRKITYSLTQSLTQLVWCTGNQSAYASEQQPSLWSQHIIPTCHHGHINCPLPLYTWKH